MKRIKLIFLLLPVLILDSCQPEPGFSDPVIPPIDPAATFDSSLLIKSVTFVAYDEDDIATDSITENYTYDTVNRKITVTWKSSDIFFDLDGVTAVFSYNSKKLLSNISYTYPAGFTFFGEELNNLTITYDNQDIPQSVVLNYRQGSPDTKTFVKTALPSGYRLNWHEIYDSNPDFWQKRMAEFDASGKCTKTTYEAPLYDNNGDIYTTYEGKDSVTYDASGNIFRIYFRGIDTSQPAIQEYLSWEFQSRNTKGSQLADQRRLLLNGMHNMPLGDHDEWFEVSVFCYNLDNFQSHQYRNLPFQTAKVYSTDRSAYDNFTAESVFDSKNRLVRFTGFFKDYGLMKEMYRIAYYK
jgi:hypothetical protein